MKKAAKSSASEVGQDAILPHLGSLRPFEPEHVYYMPTPYGSYGAAELLLAALDKQDQPLGAPASRGQASPQTD